MDRNASLADANRPEAARRALAQQARELAAATLLTTAGDTALQAAAALVSQATALLSGAVRSSRYEGIAGLAPGSAANEAVWETHAAFGPANALAPPVEVVDAEGRVDGTVTFGSSWEGGPGLVFGGFLAAVFDGLLGRAVISAGHLGVTRSLTVRYLRPTPLHTPVRVSSVAGGRVGRNVEVTAQMWVGDVLTCEAEAVFTCVDPERYRI